MAKKKRTTLPKDFGELIEAGDLDALKAVFETCDLNAKGGYGKGTALSFFKVPDELTRWLIEQGADVDARNRYQRTPIYEQAGVWSGNPELLLDLGADIEAADYQDQTPLHNAADNFQAHAARVLVARGANVHAKDKMGDTPLASALARCQNIYISRMADVAEILLGAGAETTPEMREQVERIGKEFEFHRANFASDSLEETDAGLKRLYALFGAAPAEARRMHDGTSKITVAATEWRDRHAELWDLLVPSQGSAKTVQGEVVRISGGIWHEIADNGGANWDADFRKMLDALVKHLASGTPLALEELEEAAALAARLRGGDDEVTRLSELAVRWVLQNPDPAPLSPPAYRR
jgi:ankyrin repeat protein